MTSALDSQTMLAPAPITWRLGRRVFSFPGPTLLMGVVNITPDSFSDGGRFLDPRQAIDQAQALIEEGADLIDLGGESTRPGAVEVSAEEEKRRVLPVLERLVAKAETPISVDTRKAEVAERACQAGAAMINDVQGTPADQRLLETVARHRVALCLMHMRGLPADMQSRAVYSDLLSEVIAELSAGLDAALAAGVEAERICLDPGIGFSKTADHNWALLRQLPRLAQLGRPLLLGVSRKSFIGAITGVVDPRQRLHGTLAAVTAAVLGGAQILRVHDVAACRHAVRVAEAVRAGRAA